jgi:diguanylate cyclase (GGDEF)-like protein
MAVDVTSSAELERMSRPVHAGLVTPAQFRLALDTLTANNVRPVSAGLSVVFTAYALIYLLRSRLAGHESLALYSILTAGAYALIWALARRFPVTPNRANATGFVIGVIAGANCVAGVFFRHPQQSALLTALAILSIAIFARSTQLFALLVLAVSGSWFIAAAAVLPVPAWREHVWSIGPAVCVSTVAHIVFRRTERRLEEAKAQLTLAAAVDDLTEVYNRRGFLMVGEHLLRQAVQGRVPVTLLFIDIDRVTLVNDSTPHVVSEETLRDLGDVLRATFREADVVGRLGGTEFCVLMVGSQQHLAADRLRQAVAEHNAAAPSRRLLLSIGEVLYLGGTPQTLRDLIARGDAESSADKARQDSA